LQNSSPHPVRKHWRSRYQVSSKRRWRRTVDDMHDEQPQQVTAQRPSEGGTGRARMSRRRAMGRMSAVATVGAVAWVVPEILTAKPAAGAALSGTGGGGGVSGGVTTSASTGGDPGTGASVGASGSVDANAPDGVATAADTTAATNPSGSLAFTGLNIQRDASVGAALVAGGWAMQHWASRLHKPAASGPSGAPPEGAGGL
jgi:hypothetical protein